MSRLKTLKRGAIWRPGNGASINIWSDLWIPTAHDRRVMTPRGHCLLETLQDLIDPHTGEWDVQLVHDNFWPIDVARIMQIPLPSQQQLDFIAWQLCKSGRFTFRSAYRAEWKAEYRTRAGIDTSVGRSMSHPVWKLLWDLSIPPKTIFLLGELYTELCPVAVI